jgi:hypothetical protein
LLPSLTTRALKASFRPYAILFLPSTVCSSWVTTHNSDFQQLAKDKQEKKKKKKIYVGSEKPLPTLIKEKEPFWYWVP